MKVILSSVLLLLAAFFVTGCDESQKTEKPNVSSKSADKSDSENGSIQIALVMMILTTFDGLVISE